MDALGRFRDGHGAKDAAQKTNAYDGANQVNDRQRLSGLILAVEASVADIGDRQILRILVLDTTMPRGDLRPECRWMSVIREVN